MTGEATLFGVCLTELQGLWGLLGWEPAQSTAGAAAAAEVTGTGAASSRLPRDVADVGAAANTVAEASGRSRIFERQQVLKALQALRGMGTGCAPPQKLKKILGLEIVYYGAF